MATRRRNNGLFFQPIHAFFWCFVSFNVVVIAVVAEEETETEKAASFFGDDANDAAFVVGACTVSITTFQRSFNVRNNEFDYAKPTTCRLSFVGN